MLSEAQTRLAVWGDPIAHSKSPALHGAAYRVLGLHWSYVRRQVSQSQFVKEFQAMDASWRGLSLTMPLKTLAFDTGVIHDRHSTLTGVANTLLLASDGPRAFNTDVGGLRRSLLEDGVGEASAARLIGAGATATSALIALSELGVTHVEVVARRPEAALPLITLGDELGVHVTAGEFTARTYSPVTVSVATLPGGTAIDAETAAALAENGGHLLDVVYGQWPTDFAVAWQEHGHSASSGIGMLLHQALLQVRVFAHGDPDVPLDDEEAVLAEMRAALMGD